MLHVSTACTMKFQSTLNRGLSRSLDQTLPLLLQGQYACVMIAHEDVEDDAHWISWLRHSAQVCLAAEKHQLSFSALGLVALLAGPG